MSKPITDAVTIARLTRERDEARDELRALVDSTDWIDGRCVIRQGPKVGSGGALDRAMDMLMKWEREPTDDQRRWPAPLYDDTPFVTCNVCRRQSYARSDTGQPCQMVQPDGRICPGRFGLLLSWT